MAKETRSLTYEERKDIMDRYHSDNPRVRKEAVEDMLAAMDEYVYFMIHRRFAKYLSMIDDLAQSGRMAIIEHMGDYNPQYKMTTFFSFHIQNALQELVNKENGESHYYAESKNIIVKTIRSLGMDIDNIDVQVLAMHLNMTTGRLNSILEKTLRKKQVELIEEDGETSGEYYDSPESAFVKAETQKEFRACLATLEPIEQIVLCMHFGFYHPKYNPDERTYKISDVQTILDKAGLDVNAINEYRSARRHIADQIYKAGLIGKRNRYQSAKDEIGLRFKDEDDVLELFNALNEMEEQSQ